MNGRRIAAWIALLILLSVGTAHAQGTVPPPSDSDLALAQRYAPALYFHPDELFRPQPVEVLVSQSRLRLARPGWFDVNILNHLSVRDLFLYHGAEYFLDAWYGDEGASDYKNYSAHRTRYATLLSPEAGGPPITAYARVVREDDHIVVQYWLFYYYNDWFNKHEGDWEMVQVILDEEETPQWAVFSQHHGGTRRPWSAVRVEEGTHPAVYVALGSHANYFWGDEVYPNIRSMGNASFVVMDRTGRVGPVIPEVHLLPEQEEAVEENPDAWAGEEWLCFEGNWGERALQADFGGPHGPAQKGMQWDQPFAWGMSQPADEAVWYAHRLRVTAEADGAIQIVALEGLAGLDLITSRDGHRVTLLVHGDPPWDLPFEVRALEPTHVRITTAYPLRHRGEVHKVACEPVALTQGERLLGHVCASCEPGMRHIAPRGTGGAVSVTCVESFYPAVWDAPDVVWLAGLLLADEVMRGIGTALLAGLGPIALYVLTLYWADRYEKEPKRLLAAAFGWGALPAILLAAAVRLFFRLPPSLLGPEAVEAIGAGLISPLVEELLKGAAVLFVFLRYPQEFDGPLDGFVYGGMVGFGFAMTGNTVSYVGAFLLHGWAGLGPPVIVQGLLYGLNHALYTAAFGVGLGWVRPLRAGPTRWAVALGSFLAAVGLHTLHNLALRRALGLSLAAILGTLAGLVAAVVLVVLILARQRRILKVELTGQVPADLYRAMTLAGGRSRAQWRALRQGGLPAWRRVRRLHRLCAELAFKRAQARLHPDEPALAQEIARLHEEIRSLQP